MEIIKVAGKSNIIKKISENISLIYTHLGHITGT